METQSRATVGGPLTRCGVAVVVVVSGSLLLGSWCRPAPQLGCTSLGQSDRVESGLEAAVTCNDQILGGAGNPGCEVPTQPACAGTLVPDAMSLGYGRNHPATAAVDTVALADQYACQAQIGRAVSSYVSLGLRRLIEGVSPEDADAEARVELDALPGACAVAVALDAGGTVLPAVGPQCAAALGPPGAPVDALELRDCLHQLLQVWVDRHGPDPLPLRPNIVLILADDQRWDTIDAKHSQDGVTPVMQRVHAELAGEGIGFSNAFTVTGECCPSRASLLSGQYAHTTGVLDNQPPDGGVVAFEDSAAFVVWLERAGYRTGLFGKYLNGYGNAAVPGTYVPPGWSEWHAFTSNGFFDYTLSENGVLVRYASADYSTDLLRDQVIAFIGESVDSGVPFLVYYAPISPHSPIVPAPRHVGRFAGLAPYRPSSWNEADVSDKPVQPPLFTPEQEASRDGYRAGQLEMLLSIDEAVGAILATLRDRGVLDDTLVVYASDSGFIWGEHRLDGKRAPYEEAVRIPLLVRYPRLAPLPRREDRLALTIDLAPTFAALAGVAASSRVEGASLLRVLDGTTPAWRSDVLAEGFTGNWFWASVRSAGWKYVERATGPAELYDLVADPYELENVLGDPIHAARITSMAARLRQLRPGWPYDWAPH
jgi:arylsulfatase A-like enzyme